MALTSRARSRGSARDLALVATFAGVMAALGTLPAVYPAGIPVPITAQSMGAMLAGAVLGSRRGFAALTLFLALVAVGLPLLAGGRGGLGVFGGPSIGYLVGFPLTAAVVGWIVERGGAPYRLVWGVVANLVGGIAVLYTLGILGTAWRAHLSIPAASVQAGWYVVGDCAKAVIAAFVARGVHAAYPGLLPGGRERNAEDRAASVHA
jgi:biotin transport system substrate-specific component